MTPLPTIANVFRVALNWRNSLPGQQAENVIHVHSTLSDAAAVADVVDGAIPVNLFVTTTSIAAPATYSVTPLDGHSATVDSPVSNPHAAGLGSTEYIPGMAAVVSLYTGERGRSYRGRVFLPWVAENMQANGILDGTHRAQLEFAWNTFIAELIASDTPLVVASYKLATATNVTSAIVQGGAGTIRRRQERVRYP